MIGLIVLAYLVIELLSLALVVHAVGLLGALVLCALGSLSGYFIVRGEGLALAGRLAGMIQHAQRTGEVPPLPLAESLPRLLAGLLLILPGFATDALAVLVLLPPLRGYVVRRVHGFIAARHHEVLRDRGIVDIEGEVLPEREPPDPPPGPSPDARRRLPPPS